MKEGRIYRQLYIEAIARSEPNLYAEELPSAS